MSIVSDIYTFLKNLSNELHQPEVIDLEYSSIGDPELRGATYGKLVAKREANGGLTYELRESKRRVDLLPARSTLVIDHLLGDAASLNEALIAARAAHGLSSAVSHVFLSARFQPGHALEAADVEALVAADRPELGSLRLLLAPHPRFLSWFERSGRGRDTGVMLSHQDMADLLLDNLETLDDPNIATAFTVIRASKSVEMSEDVADATSSTIVSRSVKGRDGAPLRIPRRIVANVPVFVGAWEPGKEPTRRCEFAVRAVPTEDGPPQFRIVFVNALDVVSAAANDVLVALRAQLANALVLRGKANIKRFDPPVRELA